MEKKINRGGRDITEGREREGKREIEEVRGREREMRKRERERERA